MARESGLCGPCGWAGLSLALALLVGLVYKPFYIEDFFPTDPSASASGPAYSFSPRQTSSASASSSAPTDAAPIDYHSMTQDQRRTLMETMIDRLSFPLAKDRAQPQFVQNSVIDSMQSVTEPPKCGPVISGLCMHKFDDGESGQLPFSPAARLAHWRAWDWNLWNLSKARPILERVVSADRVATDGGHRVAQMRTEMLFDGPSNYQMRDRGFKEYPVEAIDNYPFSKLLTEVKSPTARQLYSTDFEKFCRSISICNDTNWDALRIRESDVLKVELDMNKMTGDSSIPLSEVPSSLVFMQEDTALQARYSEYHTMRVQLQGVVRCLIVPTKQLKHVNLFPHVHSSNQQSQVDFYERSLLQSDFPSFTKVNGSFLVELHPMDVLYIPPYYLVHTETPLSADINNKLDSEEDSKVLEEPMMSVFLDVLSPSIEQVLLMQAINVGVPFNTTIVRTMSRAQRIIAAQIFLMHVLSRIRGLKSPTTLSRRLYSNRFSLLFPENGQFIQTGDKDFKCYRGDQDIIEQTLSLVDQNEIVKYAKYIAKLVNDKRINRQIVELFVDNYVEHIGRWAMGNAKDTVFFIRSCLQFNKYLEVIEEIPGDPVLKIGGDSSSSF